LKDLTAEIDGQILFTKNLSRTFLLKAEVVGAAAVVTNASVSEDLTVDLPILKMDLANWDELLSLRGKVRDILVNSRVGRLLVVIE
jgi:hypothetical protein